MSKKLLILQFRPDDASDNEFESFLKFGKLKEDEVHRVRLEYGEMPEINLNDYWGVISGGGPYNMSDNDDKKSDFQKKAEKELFKIIGEVVEKDIPYLGTCYGVGALGTFCGGIIGKEKYGEEVAAVNIILNEEGKKDQLCQGLPEVFQAIVGHKEACQVLPTEAVLLASSKTCPVQMFRIKNNVYATQFHPELDLIGAKVRTKVYDNMGYFKPGEGEAVIKAVANADLSQMFKIIENFVKLFKK